MRKKIVKRYGKYGREASFSSVFSSSFPYFLPYFPDHFTIQLAFLPYFSYLVTIQLVFLPKMRKIQKKIGKRYGKYRRKVS
jgi:hypothetical protein